MKGGGLVEAEGLACLSEVESDISRSVFTWRVSQTKPVSAEKPDQLYQCETKYAVKLGHRGVASKTLDNTEELPLI